MEKFLMCWEGCIVFFVSVRFGSVFFVLFFMSINGALLNNFVSRVSFDKCFFRFFFVLWDGAGVSVFYCSVLLYYFSLGSFFLLSSLLSFDLLLLGLMLLSLLSLCSL